MGAGSFLQRVSAGALDFIAPEGSSLDKTAQTAYNSATYKPKASTSPATVDAYPGAMYYNAATGNTEVFDGANWNVQDVLGSETVANTGSTRTGGSGGSGSNGYSAADVAAIQMAIDQGNSQLGLLDQEAGVGLANIAGDYTTAKGTLKTNKERTYRDYQDTRNQSHSDNVEARSNIQSDVGRQTNALQRLLRGNSSASQIVAPYAAALQGTQRLQGVTKNFGQNMQGLDKNWGDYEYDWNNADTGLDTQKTNQENALRADVGTKRSSLLSNLAQMQMQKTAASGGSSAAALAAANPYIAQVNALAPQIVNYGAKYAGGIKANAPTYKQASLAKYDYAPMTAPGQQPTSSYQSNINPIFRPLLPEEEQKKEQVVA